MKDLRLKAVTLLALTLMLRPSDIAPDGVVFDDSSGLIFRQNFTLKNFVFEQNHMKVTFFGIKNDVQRKGFEVILQKNNVVKIDPVHTLYDYIERTREHRCQDGPVFITLRSPYNAVDYSTVSRILEEAIVLAGLSTKEFSAKSFRPTGATTAIAQNFNPEIVRKVGRWKNQEVFFDHNVQSKTPLECAESVLCAK